MRFHLDVHEDSHRGSMVRYEDDGYPIIVYQAVAEGQRAASLPSGASEFQARQHAGDATRSRGP